jgi:hypothetical protein
MMRVLEHDLRFAQVKVKFDGDFTKPVLALPIGAIVLGVSLNVSAAFSTGGTVAIGSSAGGADYLSAAAATTAGTTDKPLFQVIGASSSVFATLGGSPTAGEATIGVRYALPTSREQDY